MKVVRIIARLNVGGPAKHVAWLTAGTRRAGIESELVAGTVPPGEDDMSYFAAAQGVEPIILAEMTREVSPKDAVAVWKLYRLLRRLRPDIIHTHTAKAGTVGRAAGFCYRWLTPAALAGRPRACRFVHTYHGHIFHSYYGRWKTLFFLTIERVLARAATDRIVAISRQQFREINGRFGVGRAEQFKVIPLGLDLDAFAGWRTRRAAARAGLGAGADDLLVGIVGRLTEIKNHSLFIESAALYLKRHAGAGASPRRVRFVVIGDGQLRAELEAQARSLGVAEHMTFTGTRPDPENFYAALDIVALTSLNEGTPLTLIEAMANARAVVATGVGGVVDLVGRPVENEAARGGVGAAARSRGVAAATDRGASSAVTDRGAESSASATDRAASSAAARKTVATETVAMETVATDDAAYAVCERGVRVRSGDAEAFCEALRLLVMDEELRRELGERGRAFVTEYYSKERLVADVLNLYEELMSPRRLTGEAHRVAAAAGAAGATKQRSAAGIEPARGKGD